MATLTANRPPKAILKRLTVLADPEHKGKHPFHDSRWIATHDASWEHSSGQWTLDGGELIASMRDCSNQWHYARLMAASPQMLWFLRSATAWIRGAGGDCETLDEFLAQFKDIA